MVTASDIFPGSIVARHVLKRSDIAIAVREIRRIVGSVHIFNVAEMDEDFKRLLTRTEDTTMTATGHLRKSAFKDMQSTGHGTLFRMGYGPTINNQSVAQEFDDGPVHHKTSEHYKEDRTAGERQGKCSRVPEDLYSQFGRRYFSNPKARRRALARSIEEIFGTSVRSARIKGDNYYYVPNLDMYVAKRSLRTARFLRTIGVS
jgi:hypothetical protein